MAVTAAKSVMAFRVLTMAVDLCRLTTRTMNVNAGHERTSKARIIHQIQLIRGITKSCKSLACVHIASVTAATATTMFWEVYNVNIVIHLAIH